MSTFSTDIHDYLSAERLKEDTTKPAAETPKDAPVPKQVPRKTDEVSIQKTVEYSRFKLVQSNREVDTSHVNRLVREIRKKNLLHLNPITVNSNYEVIDGQHRLRAAEVLGVPIYFIQDETVNDGDIAGMNSNKRVWTMMDFINYYANKGYQAYIEFCKFCNKHNDLSPSLLIALCDKKGIRCTDNIRSGELDVSNMSLAETIIGNLKDFMEHRPQIAKQARFIEALLFIHNTGEYDHKRMLQKLSFAPTMLTPCVTKKQYIHVLQNLYNYKAREENIVQFAKR